MANKSLSKEEMDQEHPLQAIVFTDAWGEEARWGPLVRRERTDDEEYDGADVGGEQRPWCLLPLLGKPLLAWTLESLSASGVDEVFIFVREGVDQIRAYLDSSSFTSKGSTLAIVVRPTKAVTAGDILREVDQLEMMGPVDYLVVQAGYLGNLNLKDKVDEFTLRRKADPSLTMSCVVSPRQAATTSTYAVHVLAEDGQLFHYEESQVFPKRKQATIPREALGGGRDVQARVDLESIGVAICSQEVAPLFTENFDYQYFYPDFVNGILTSDLLGKTICCTVVGDYSLPSTSAATRPAEWGGVVTNTRSYDAVSRAILARQAYPFAPDENMPDEGERYKQLARRVYQAKRLVLNRSCKVESTSLIGTDVATGSDGFITHSVIGDNVSLGDNVTIEGSYIFEGARIGDGVVVKDSIIGEGAVIGAGSTVLAGSLIAAGAVLGPHSALSGARISTEESPVVPSPSVEATLGESSQAYVWPAEEHTQDLDDEDDEDSRDPRNLTLSRLGTGQLSTLLLSASLSESDLSEASEVSETDDSEGESGSDFDEDDEAAEAGKKPRIAGLGALIDEEQDKMKTFVPECLSSLDRSFAEDHTADNAGIEINTMRMSYNVDFAAVRSLVIPYILKRADGDKSKVGKLVARWKQLVTTLTGEGRSAEVHCLLEAQRCAVEHVPEQQQDSFFLFTLRAFYENDVVEDESVFEWYQDPRARQLGGDQGRKLWIASKPFVEFLQEDSDEDESDEDESDEESE